MNNPSSNFKADTKADIEAFASIPAVANILKVVCHTTGMGFAAVAKVTENRWIAYAVNDKINFGLVPGGELRVETTLCHEVRQQQEIVVIDHVSQSSYYCNHPTPAMYGFQSYISVPIVRRDGSFFGTLCSIDPNPNQKLNDPEVIEMFKLYADLISFHLYAVEQLEQSAISLQEERKTAEFREQFIAILGHDLRNPVGAVSNAAQMLLRMPMDEKAMRMAHIVQDASFRIKGLIDNMLDFARGRLGDGITLNRSSDQPLQEILNQVILELRMIWPNRQIDVHMDLPEPVNCDCKRVAQLFSNLLSNALTHGNPALPVSVNIQSSYTEFILSVSNPGIPIPPAIMTRIFEPFSRGDIKPGQQGLGLGLYIASEIANAHGGTLLAASTPEKTTFTFKLPAA